MLSVISSLSLLLTAALTHAIPLVKRDTVSQCNHGFAYTFDDGPYIHNTDIVNKFASRGAHTTFFVNGNNYECIYSDQNIQRLRHAYESGMQIASHTWSHADLTSLSHAQIDTEIQRLDEAFVKILGVRPKFIRPPYGSLNNDVANYITNTYGKTIVLWDLDSGDSTGGNEQSSVDFYYGLSNQSPNTPHLTLSHETLDWSAAAVLNDGTLDVLVNKGFPMLTVAECLDRPAYDVVGGYGTPDSTWCCDCNWTPGGGNPPPPPPPPPACKQTYKSVAGDTCQTLDNKFNLVSGTILKANSFLTCNDIWVGTPICVPDGPYNNNPPPPPPSSSSSAPPTTPTCKQTYRSVSGDTCQSLDTKFNLVSGTILKANSFLTCNDIWVNTPICVPDGPYNSGNPPPPPPPPTGQPGCTQQTYRPSTSVTCANVEGQFALPAGQVLQRNSYVNCNDIWSGTPLNICVPTLSPSDPQTCTQTYKSVAGDNCANIGAKFGTTAQWIKAWNGFLNCIDVWVGTTVCVRH